LEAGFEVLFGNGDGAFQPAVVTSRYHCLDCGSTGDLDDTATAP
jgi:hypothetical protein